jgi:hypothetical protein
MRLADDRLHAPRLGHRGAICGVLGLALKLGTADEMIDGLAEVLVVARVAIRWSLAGRLKVVLARRIVGADVARRSAHVLVALRAHVSRTSVAAGK